MAQAARVVAVTAQMQAQQTQAAVVVLEVMAYQVLTVVQV